MIYLEGGDDFKCPHCGHGWSVESWSTEYNDPLVGVSRVFCSVCDKYFEIEVQVITTITVLTPPVKSPTPDVPA